MQRVRPVRMSATETAAVWVRWRRGGSISAQATITRDPSTPRWSFLQPRRPRPPCVAAAHSPSPTMDSPVLSTMRCRLVPGRARRSARARC